MDKVDQLLDRLLAEEDTESELGRARAYRRMVRYAEENLALSHDCNLFLFRAAERLGQNPLMIPVTLNRVALPTDAKLCFYYHEEDGPVLVGNTSGLRYLGGVLTDLSLTELPGESVLLEEDQPPFVGESYGLLLFHEEEAWFDSVEEGTEEQLVADWEAELERRIVASQDVVAIQFAARIPPGLDLTAQKLYRVESIRELELVEAIPRKPFVQSNERVRVVSLNDDEGAPLRLAVDLDDPDIAFYYSWHLEQFLPGQ